MGLKDLPTEQMIGISANWVDPAKDRPAIEEIPRARGLLPVMDEVHRALLQSQPADTAVKPELRENRVETKRVDLVHDRKTRGGSLVLMGFAELADDPAVAQRLEELHARIYTRGLAVIQIPPIAEAGEVELVEQRLTPADRELLGSLPCPGGTTLLDAHQARVAAGRRLGELARRRVELESEPTTPSPAPTPGDVQRARNAWIRVVHAFVDVLDLQPLPPEPRRRLLGPLEDTVARLPRRAPSKPA